MSFNSNDTSKTINLGNYEEYFIMYMDNELSDAQVKMVDAFLLSHPDLRSEFEILMSTKLPAEEVFVDKESLLSGSMKLSAIDEELLLYIDNELPADKKKILELELSSNNEYQEQHRLLAKTKLDAAEIISYPNKEELYRKTERVVAFKLYWRIAAAVILVVAMGVFYFMSNSSSAGIEPLTAETTKSGTPTLRVDQNNSPAEQPSEQTAVIDNGAKETNKAATETGNTMNKSVTEDIVKKENDLLAANDVMETEMKEPLERGTTQLDIHSTVVTQTASFDPSKQIINTSGVTSALSQRNTINATEPTVPNGDVASNDEHKGSFKSFLRKATRMIERKTGLDPTSGDDEELLIGAVAVKLK